MNINTSILYGLREDFEPIPTASHIHNITLEENDSIISIGIWMAPVCII